MLPRYSLFRLLCLVPLALSASACGEITVTSDTVPGFNPASAVWQVESSGGANRHRFVLTNVSGYCGKKKNAEADRVDAQQRHEERLAEGYGVCESQDLLLDDLAAAYRNLHRSGARFLTVWIDREGMVTWDDRTFPEAGSYNQVGAVESGRFTGQLQAYEDRVEQARADAYTCLSPEEVDATNYNEFLFEEEPGMFRFWDLDSGNLEVTADGEEWDVDVSATLLSGSGSVGSVDARFTGSRCDVPTTALD